MIYRCLILADLHWGVMDYSLQKSQYQFISDTIKELEGKLDLLVIAGDYWESRVILNNKIALEGIEWMHDLVHLALSCGVKAIRVIRGTRGHDNDQLNCFIDIEKQLYNENNQYIFRTINTCTYEETLPGLRAFYCPEENMPQTEYFETYKEILNNSANIMFFHGSFNHIMPEIAVDLALQSGEFVYDYHTWDQLVNGPMFGGHWHNGETKGKTTYIGTPDIWNFASYANYSKPGIGLVSFNTEDSSYFYKKIVNPNYQIYHTMYIDTSNIQSIEDCQTFAKRIEQIKDELIASNRLYHLKIQINITNDALENKKWIRYFQDCFGSTKRVKLEVKNRLQKLRKEKIQSSHQNNIEKFGFIYSSSLSLAQKIHEYIKIRYGKDLELESILEILNQYQS